MLLVGPLAFVSPWLLLVLPALPALWWLLRVTPPAPRTLAFPAVRLLADLPQPEETPARTPWWLLLLRLLAAALVIVGLAGPVFGPGQGFSGTGTLLVVVDDGWAAGPDWSDRMAATNQALDAADRTGRAVALLATAPAATGDAPRVLGPMPAGDLRARLAALRPKPWAPDHTAALAAFSGWREAQVVAGAAFGTLLVADGLEHGAPGTATVAASVGGADRTATAGGVGATGILPSRAPGQPGDPPSPGIGGARLRRGAGPADGAAQLAAALAEAGPLTIARDATRPVRLLPPPVVEADRLRVTVLQTPVPGASVAGVLARTGDGRALARAAVAIGAGETRGEAVLELPVELRNQVLRLELEPNTGAGAAGGVAGLAGAGGVAGLAGAGGLLGAGGAAGVIGAGGVVLLDERFRRRPVGLLPGTEGGGADAPLIGDLFYLERALGPTAELRRGTVATLLARPIAVLALADRPLAEGAERDAVARWVEAGGLLLRFAGPRLAERPDPLLPVPLRAERQLGGSLSWEQPQRLAPFPEGSPFAGLAIPAEVTIERQVLAEPSPRLSERTWVRLADGTPLVTAEARGAGRIVLFHVTANADWSNLPLSGLFVQMLRRLVALSAGITGQDSGGQESGASLAPLETLDGFGRLGAPPPVAASLPATAIDATVPSPRHPPGWYGPAGQTEQRRALNLGSGLPPPRAAAPPPEGASLRALGDAATERSIGPWLLAGALLLLLADLLATLRLRGLLEWRGGAGREPASGGQSGARTATASVRAALLAALCAASPAALAQPAEATHALASRLAFVTTGDSAVDETLRSGLVGLSDYVNRRTAAALAEPVGVAPGSDDLSVFPLLYWVVLPDAPVPDAAAAAALNGFMRQGGIILFDTRDEGTGEGFSPGARAALRRVTRPLAIPPLAIVAEEHVLRRAFYLLPELPGRFAGGPVWVARDVDRANDSVSPVIMGGHDWAAAWAVDGRGNNPFAVVPGGARQRTLAYRFGVNLVMYALTGNYKGDQVHVPAILERLGN